MKAMRYGPGKGMLREFHVPAFLLAAPSRALIQGNEMVTLKLDPQSEIARALELLDEEPVVLESNGKRFVVTRAQEEATKQGDAEAFEKALRTATSIFSREEVEHLKRDIYRWREEGSRPFDRP